MEDVSAYDVPLPILIVKVHKDSQITLRGQDLRTNRVFLIETFSADAGPLSLTSDRAETSLVWVEEQTARGITPQHPARIRSYNLASGRTSILLESQQHLQVLSRQIAFESGVLYYNDASDKHSGLFARTIATNKEELISANGGDPVVSDGVILYTTLEQRVRYGPPHVWLHLRQLADSADRVVMEADGSGLHYMLSGDSIVWSFLTAIDTQVHRYQISNGRDSILAASGRYADIAGKLAVWTTTINKTEHTPSRTSITIVDITSGTLTTLVESSPLDLETVGVSSQFGPAIMVNDVQTGLRMLYVGGQQSQAGRVRDGLSPQFLNTNTTTSAEAAPNASASATPNAIADGQITRMGNLFTLNGQVWTPYGVQLFVPRLGINGKTMRDEEFNDLTDERGFWLSKAQKELYAKSVRVYVDLPGEGDNGGAGNRVSQGTIYRFAEQAYSYGLRVGLVLHNSDNFVMNNQKRDWIVQLLQCLRGQATNIDGCKAANVTPNIFYMSADNELNNHASATYGCPAYDPNNPGDTRSTDCFDYEDYVSAANAWVEAFVKILRDEQSPILTTVGISTEPARWSNSTNEDSVVHASKHFFRVPLGARKLAEIVDFISPHNYGGGGQGIFGVISSNTPIKPVLLEEYGFPTDPLSSANPGFTEGPSICRTNPADSQCNAIAPRYVQQNIDAIEQHFAGGMAWMLSDMQEKNTQSCSGVNSALYTGAFAIAGKTCGGTITQQFGALKSTGFRICVYHRAGQIESCQYRVYLPLAANPAGTNTINASRRASTVSTEAYPGPGTPTAEPYPGPVTPTPTGGTYPATNVLDTFNRADGDVGSAWIGDVGGYTIRSNQTQVLGGGLVYYNQLYGTNQEVYVTLPTINQNAQEVDLLLKGQGTSQCDVLEVWYIPGSHTVQVVTCQNDVWTQHGSTLPLNLQPGDRFGARVLTDGTVTIYQNSTIVGNVQVDDTWSYRANGGRIGLWMIDASGNVIDDFGGGTLP